MVLAFSVAVAREVRDEVAVARGIRRKYPNPAKSYVQGEMPAEDVNSYDNANFWLYLKTGTMIS